MLDETDVQMAEQRIMGKNYKEIGKAFGMSAPGAFYRLKRQEVRELIERINDEIITGCLQTSAKNIKHAIDSYQTTDLDGRPSYPTVVDGAGNTVVDTQLRDHGFKASMKILETASIFPSNQTTTITHNNILNIVTHEVSPQIQRLLGAIKENDMPKPIGEVIDAEEV